MWTNRLPLPTKSELEQWECEDEEGKGFEGNRVPGKDNDKSFHVFPKGGDARYINALHDWALQADISNGKGKEQGKGKEPPFWGDEKLWQRGIYAQAKLRFEKAGRKAKTLEELGFRYEKPVRDYGDSTAQVAVPSDAAG